MGWQQGRFQPFRHHRAKRRRAFRERGKKKKKKPVRVPRREKWAKITIDSRRDRDETFDRETFALRRDLAKTRRGRLGRTQQHETGPADQSGATDVLSAMARRRYGRTTRTTTIP